MSAQIPPVPDNPTVGFADWTNVTDNVRELDLEWLQNRTVVRFDSQAAVASYATNPDKVSGALEEGQVIYLIGTKQLVVNVGSGVYRKALLSSLIDIAEVSGVATLSIGGTGGLTFNADGSMGIVSRLKVGTDRVVLDNTGVHITIGGTTATLATNGTDLTVDRPITAPVLNSSGAVTGVTLTITGAATMGSVTTGALAATASSLGVAQMTSALIAAGPSQTTINSTGMITQGILAHNQINSDTEIIGVGAVKSFAKLIGRTTDDHFASLMLNGVDLVHWETPYFGLMQWSDELDAWERINGPIFKPEGNVIDRITALQGRQERLEVKMGSAVAIAGDADGEGTADVSGPGLDGLTMFKFDTPFPHNCGVVLCQNGDQAQGKYLMFSINDKAAAYFRAFVVESFPQAFGVSGGGVVHNRAVRADYIAIGW